MVRIPGAAACVRSEAFIESVHRGLRGLFYASPWHRRVVPELDLEFQLNSVHLPDPPADFDGQRQDFRRRGAAQVDDEVGMPVAHHGAAGGNGDDWAKAITIDATNRILVAGASEGSGGTVDMAVWWYR